MAYEVFGEFIIKSLKFLTYVYLYMTFGFLKSILIYIILNYLYEISICKMFNIEALASQEYMFAPLPVDRMFTMTGWFELDSYEPEKIKHTIVEKAIKKFNRLRKKMIFFLGAYYWQEYPVEDVLDKVKILDINLETTDQILDYCQKHQQEPFDKYKDFPYEFHLLKHGKHGCILFVKFDHIMADGIGMLGLLIAMADNYHIDLYPKVNTISFLYRLFAYVLSPYYIIKNLFYNLNLKHRKSPFRLGADLKRTGIKKAAMSKKFSFDVLNKIARQHGLTFNDLLTSVVSKVAKKYM